MKQCFRRRVHWERSEYTTKVIDDYAEGNHNTFVCSKSQRLFDAKDAQTEVHTVSKLWNGKREENRKQMDSNGWEQGKE